MLQIWANDEYSDCTNGKWSPKHEHSNQDESLVIFCYKIIYLHFSTYKFPLCSSNSDFRKTQLPHDHWTIKDLKHELRDFKTLFYEIDEHCKCVWDEERNPAFGQPIRKIIQMEEKIKKLKKSQTEQRTFFESSNFH